MKFYIFPPIWRNKQSDDSIGDKDDDDEPVEVVEKARLALIQAEPALANQRKYGKQGNEHHKDVQLLFYISTSHRLLFTM